MSSQQELEYSCLRNHARLSEQFSLKEWPTDKIASTVFLPENLRKKNSFSVYNLNYFITI